MGDRLFVKVTKESLPLLKDRYPFLYLERGRLEIDDSSVKWIDSEGHVISLPIATVSTLLLGPGTSITHEAVKVLSDANTTVCWVGEDSLLFYATGISPVSNTRNFRLQASLSMNAKSKITVARRMYAKRFPDEDMSQCTLSEMMGKEGKRLKKMYCSMAEKYQVGWKGRYYEPGHFELSDTTNKIITSTNAMLYALILSGITSFGFSPYLGFIHSGSPLPFVYDLADLYKEDLTIDLSFRLTKVMAGFYDRHRVMDEFRKGVSDYDLLGRLKPDIDALFEGVK